VSPEEIVDAQVAAYNARDLDQFLRCYAADVQVHGFPSGRRLADRSDGAFADRYRALFEASPDLHAEIVARVVHGRIVVDQERVTGFRGSEAVNAAVIYEVGPDVIERVWFLDAP
jgi:hypothetical protein